MAKALPTPGRPRFAVDAMLGSLARKLRALGFDSSYFREGDDAALLGLAARECRVILTSDRLLSAKAAKRLVGCVVVRGTTDGRRIGEVARYFRARSVTLTRGDPLCTLCGRSLVSLGRAQVSDVVPDRVLQGHRFFFRCSSCGHLYWRGSHWKKLRSLARRLAQDQVAPHRRRRRAGRQARKRIPGGARPGPPSSRRAPAPSRLR